MNKVSIIGCGPGGQALAAYFSQQGITVALCATPDHPGDIEIIAQLGGVHIEHQGVTTFVPIAQATTDLAAAIPESEAVFIVVPSFAQESVFQCIFPLLTPYTPLITLEANFSTLTYLKSQRFQAEKNLIYADISTLPFACRVKEPGVVTLLGVKEKMGIACYPKEYTPVMAKRLNPYFPSHLTCYDSVLEIGLNSLSGILHPAAALLNAGRIGSGQSEFYFYKEGVSPAIAALLEQLDKERRYIGALYGLHLPYCMTIEKEFYGKQFDSIYAFYQNSQVHNSQYTLCPKSLEDRYISQDVPYVLVPWYCLGERAGYQAPLIKSLIDIASALNQKDYRHTGRNLFNMHWEQSFLPEKRKTELLLSSYLNEQAICG